MHLGRSWNRNRVPKPQPAINTPAREEVSHDHSQNPHPRRTTASQLRVERLSLGAPALAAFPRPILPARLLSPCLSCSTSLTPSLFLGVSCPALAHALRQSCSAWCGGECRSWSFTASFPLISPATPWTSPQPIPPPRLAVQIDTMQIRQLATAHGGAQLGIST